MRIKRTLKKGICYVASFAMVFTMFLGMGTIEAKAAGAKTIYINGYALTVSESSPTAYYLNGGSVGSESNYNAKLEYDADESILTLNGLDIILNTTTAKNGIDVSSGDFKIVLEGDNKITDDVSSSSYLPFKADSSNVTIEGDGTLTIVDNDCGVSRVVSTNSLYITDSASLVIDIDKMRVSAYVIDVSNGFKMDEKSSLAITVDNCIRDCAGINYPSSSNEFIVADSANLDIKLSNGSGYSNSTLYGINAENAVTFSTSQDVDISVGKNYNNYGIKTSGAMVVDGTCINVRLEDAGNVSQGISSGALTIKNGASINVTTSIVDANSISNGTNGTEYGLAVGDITMQGASSINVKLGDAMQLWGVATSKIDIQDGSTIDVQCGDATYQIYGILSSGEINMKNESSIDIETGTGGDVYGINTNSISLEDTSSVETNVTGVWDSHPYAAVGVQTNTFCYLYDDAIMTNVVHGSGILNAYGVRAVTYYMEGNSSCNIDVDGAKFFCAGINTNTFTATAESKLEINTGDITPFSLTGTLSCGVYASNSATVSGEATVSVVSGTGEAGFGLYGSSYVIKDDATLEITSDISAFQVAPTFDVLENFRVKAGASKATATNQNDTAKQTAATYTDNAYVLINPFDVISSVVVTDIDTPVAYGEFDTTATCATTGVKSVSVVWTLGGATKQDVEPDTEYTVEVTLYPEDTHGFSNTTTATINGNQALTTTINNDGSLTATYKMTSVDTKLTAIENPADITGVKNGTALANITLPGKVNIETAVGDMEASVVWDRDNIYQGSFTPASKDAQTFTLKGTVTLPNGVDANGIVLAAYLEINVAAGEQDATTATTTEDDSATTGSTSQTDGTTTENKTDNTDGSVNTGDNTPVGVLLMLLGITCVGMAVVGKKNEEL